MDKYKDIDFSELGLDVIIEYISKKCDAEVILLLAFTEENFKKLSEKNNLERNFYVLFQKFKEFKEIVEYQIRKEELILFPFLKQITSMEHTSGTKSAMNTKFGNPIDIISRDHSKILTHLTVLKKYYADFLDEENELIKLCINSLLELEQGIKENFNFHKTILFPKILAMQNTQQNTIN